MRRWRFRVSRTIDTYEYATVTVDADNEEEAREAAHDCIYDGEDIDGYLEWDYGDGGDIRDAEVAELLGVERIREEAPKKDVKIKVLL